VPLLDHFHPPLSQRRPWESFHATWCSALADFLNREVLPPGYIALEQVSARGPVEIDVATYTEEASGPPAAGGGTATLPRAVWTPPAPPLILPAVFPERFAVEIVATEGGRTLVAALELVSPGNKDRESKRRLFAARCAAYLARGVGLVIVDAVTSRQGNLHNELVNLLGLEPAFRMPAAAGLYAVAYRPLRRDQEAWVETWPMTLAVGQPLPTVPLSLEAERCLAVDLEAAYLDACQRRRVDDAKG
jgi:hypothetical protein